MSTYSEIGDTGPPWDSTEVGTPGPKGCAPLGALGFPFAGTDYDANGGVHIGANGYIRFGSGTGCAEVRGFVCVHVCRVYICCALHTHCIL